MRTLHWFHFGICACAMALAGCGGGGGGGGGGALPATPQPLPGVTVSGRVTDATTDAGVSNALVSITEQARSLATSRQSSKTDVTDAGGYYAIEDVQPGKATLEVRVPGYGHVRIETEVAADRPSASLWVTLVPDQATQPTSVALTPTSPSVTAGSTVQFTAEVLPAAAGASASFAVQGNVGAINASGLFTATKQGTGTIVAYVGSVQDSTQVTVTAPPPTKGSITGLVADTSSRGIAAAMVTANGAFVLTAGDGTYTLTDLSPGSHEVTADASGYTSASQTVQVVAGQVATADFALATSIRVTISPSSVNMALGGSQAFTGTVTGTSNTSVTWSVQEGAPGGTIDANGNYIAPGERGTYHVMAASATTPNQTAVATVTVQAGSATGTIQ